MGIALEKSSWPSILRFKRVPFCPFDCSWDIYQQHFWVLIFFFVTDRLVKAWDQCLCHQAAHIHTGDPDWWFSLVGDQNTEWFKFFFKVKFAVMVCFLSSHISVIILVRISTLSPYSKLIKSQDSFISRLIYLIFTCLQLDPWLTQTQTCRSSLCSSAMYLSSWSGHVWSENQGICINQSLTFVKRSMFSGKQKQNTRTTITKTRTTTRPKDQILLREHFTGQITFVQSRNKFVCNARSCPHKSRPSLATNIIRESVVICSPTHIGETLWSKEWGVKRLECSFLSSFRFFSCKRSVVRRMQLLVGTLALNWRNLPTARMSLHQMLG